MQAAVVHDDAPDNAVYVPAAQFVHVTSAAVLAPGAFAPNLPAAQATVHDVALEQPPPLYRPGRQFTQELHCWVAE